MHWGQQKNNQNDESQKQPNQNNLPPDRTSPKRITLSFFWGTGIILLVPLILCCWLWIYANTPSLSGKETVILIKKGSGVRQIQSILVQNGIISDNIFFPILAKITGTAGRLRAGEYLIRPEQTPLDILKQMARGKVIRHLVTIPEGKTVEQIADILSTGNWIDRKRFISLTRDPVFISTLDFKVANLEGYLFPDTYMLTRDGAKEEKIVGMMVNRFLAIWKDLEMDLPNGFTRHQVITLASLVEKETAKPEERPIIARVFLNRLTKNMRLQSDPTVIYGLDEFDGDLTKKDLQQENPYNTYVIKGLPPGPICNPGSDAIAAVLHPADVPYLYFVSRNDGSHHFSSSLREHNKAVRKYQLSKKE